MIEILSKDTIEAHKLPNLSVSTSGTERRTGFGRKWVRLYRASRFVNKIGLKYVVKLKQKIRYTHTIGFYHPILTENVTKHIITPAYIK